jgi:hypothetical protein
MAGTVESEAAPIGGYRTMTAASSCYAARPIFQNVIVLIAESVP